MAVKGDGLAWEDVLGSTQLFSVSSFCQLLVPFKICYHPKVTRAWSCQAWSTSEEILESLWAAIDGS